MKKKYIRPTFEVVELKSPVVLYAASGEVKNDVQVSETEWTDEFN